MNTHIGINVTKLEASMDFYSKLFDTSPVKVREGYAKYMLEQPQLNFTLNLSDEVFGNQVGHFGFQVQNAHEVIENKRRLEKLGMETRDELNVSCCYAVQDKFWVADPDGNEWEFFFTKGDSEISSATTSCCPA